MLCAINIIGLNLYQHNLITGQYTSRISRSTRPASWRLSCRWRPAGLAVCPLWSPSRRIILRGWSAVSRWRRQHRSQCRRRAVCADGQCTAKFIGRARAALAAAAAACKSVSVPSQASAVTWCWVPGLFGFNWSEWRPMATDRPARRNTCWVPLPDSRWMWR
jgi:hypothetical protein